MKKIFTAFFLLGLICNHAVAQKNTPVAADMMSTGAIAIEMSAPRFGKANIDANSPFYAKAIAVKHGGTDGDLSEKEIENYLEVNKYIYVSDATKRKVSTADMVVHPGFRSNPFNGGTPMDNAIAVSNDGTIVSAVNTNFSIFDSTGGLITNRTFNGIFFGDPNLNASIFDPRVIYDSESDRFIMCILHGSEPAKSRLVVLFSETSNPADGWNIYLLPGNPLNNNTWLDYPHMAVTNDEIFISGNLFTPTLGGNIFNQAVVYQINKHDGYNNEASLDYQVWQGIQSADNSGAFSLVPIRYGFEGTQGPGMYFIATRNNNGGTEFNQRNYVDLYFITDTKDSPDEEISTQKIKIADYARPSLARQDEILNVLSCGDCRMQSAFILGDIIHYTFGERGANNRAAIRYGRLDISDMSLREKTFGSDGNEYYAFPSVASFTNVESRQGAIICFEASSNDKYPEIRVVGIDHDMNFTESKLVKEGEASVRIFGSATQRWGDYTGIARRHGAANPEVWVCAAYGFGAGIWSNYNAKITTSSDSSFVPKPADTIRSDSDKPIFYMNDNATTRTISVGINIPEDAHYTFTLYDAGGQKVRILLSDRFTPEHKFLVFNTSEFANGTYILAIESDKGYYQRLKILILNDN